MRNSLCKEAILECTEQGLRIFQYYLQHYYPTGIKERINIPNPFLDKPQVTGSFNVFRDHKGQWRFKDFAHPECKGDCFQLVRMARPELKNASFALVLKAINQDLRLGLLERENDYSHNKCPVTPFDYAEHGFSTTELSYWESYGITLDVLKKYGIKAIDSFKTFSVKGRKEYTIRSMKDDPIFAFLYGNALKIYRPLTNNKRYKWRYLGERDPEFIFGLDLLPDCTPIVILTSGEKDALALIAHGFPAICLNSETATLSNEKLERIKAKAERIVLCYDNDSTGKQQAQTFAEEFDLAIINIPPSTGKDVSDFFKSGNSTYDFEVLRDKAINYHDATCILRKDKSTLPQFPVWIYGELPNSMKQLLSLQEKAKQTDILFLGLLIITAAASPNVFTQNSDGKNTLDLYAIVMGEFASGKGELSKVRRAGNFLNDFIIQTSREAYKTWELERENSTEESKTKPKPYIQSFYTSGDISTTAIKQKLHENQGRAFVFETEIDTLNNALRQKWGDFSDILRKAFHHEAISMQRVQTRDAELPFLHIPSPALSLLLSGTPNQMTNLLGSGGVQNGLYSRMLMYIIHDEGTWISRRPTASGERQIEWIEQYGRLLKRIWQTLDLRKDVYIRLRDEQFTMIDVAFSNLFDSWKEHSPEIAAITKRSALMAQKIASILCLIRLFEKELIGETDKNFCTDSEVRIGIEVARICFLHSAFFALTALIKKASTSDKTERAIQLHANGMSIRAIAKEIDTPKSTIEGWLKKARHK